MSKFNYELIAKDYLPNPETDDDRLLETKECIQALSKMERRILLTYVELQTYAQAAKEFHVSPPTFKNYLQGILEKVRGCSGEEEITEEEKENDDINNNKSTAD